MSETFFSLAGAWDTLAESARQHDEKAFHAASSSLDTRPELVIRGLAYMTYRLAVTPADEDCPGQTRSALFATSEMLALVAAMLEHQSVAEMEKRIAEMVQQGASRKSTAQQREGVTA